VTWHAGGYTGSPLTNCTANVTGDGGLNTPVTPVTYSNNTNGGTAGASAIYGGDANHSGSTGIGSFAITQAATATGVTAPTITYAANGAVTVSVTSGSGTVLGTVTLTVDGGAPLSRSLSAGSTTFSFVFIPSTPDQFNAEALPRWITTPMNAGTSEGSRERTSMTARIPPADAPTTTTSLAIRAAFSEMVT